MAATLGSYGPSAFGGGDNAKPGTVVMQYTGHSDYTEDEPPTYVCVGKNDGIANWQTMKARVDALSAMGVPTEFHAYEGLSHGFGLGTGTVAEGWFDDAVAFWEKQMLEKDSEGTDKEIKNIDIKRAGTSTDTVATPSDFPSAYHYGLGTVQSWSMDASIHREYMLKKMPLPSGTNTVKNVVIDTSKIQAFYLWEKENVPAVTTFTKDMTGYFDEWDFRPYVTAIPVRNGVKPKGAVVLMAGGAYQFRGNYTDSLPTAAALRELGFQTFIVDYRLHPYIQEEGALDVARAVRFIRKNADKYDIKPDNIAVMGYSAGAIQAGEFLMHYDEDVLPSALDKSYTPDELDRVKAHVAADGMIYGF